jgi:hypothetical protein
MADELAQGKSHVLAIGVGDVVHEARAGVVVSEVEDQEGKAETLGESGWMGCLVRFGGISQLL